MTNNIKQRIAALTLATTMLLSGCGNDSFKLTENENNELVAVDDTYIDDIRGYYVVEVYNKITKQNEIFIGKNTGNFVDGRRGYRDIFTNLQVSVNAETSIFEYVKQTNLSNYIVSLEMGQAKYSYDDMKNIYEAIKEIYIFEDSPSLRRVLTNSRKI